MNRILVSLLTASAVLSSSAVLAQTATQAASQPPGVTLKGGAAKGQGMAGAAGMATVTATVEAIDPATRSLVLRGPQGRTLPMSVGEAVKNYEQIKVGDKVVVQYARAVTAELKKGGDGIREMVQREGTAVNPGGQLPGASAGRMTTVLANIWSVDRKTNIVALRGPKGNIVDVKVEDPALLKNIKVGDQVEVKYAEAVAAGITRLAK